MPVRRACRWSLFYKDAWFCKLPAVRDPGKEPPKPLQNGCPENCKDMDIVPWKRDLYGDEYDDEAEDKQLPKVVDWDDET